MRDGPWVPFWLPFLVMAIIATVLITLGITLLQIAIHTHDTIPGLHSGVVIIVALIVSLVITGAATLYARGGRSAAPADEHPGH